MKIDRFLRGLTGKMDDPEDYIFMSVAMPGDLDPFDRHYRFSVHIDAELRLAGLGCSTGGGTLYQNIDFDDPDNDGEDEIASTIIDVNAADMDGARMLLRLHLPELGAPAGAVVQYGEHEDRYDGANWHLGEPRSIEEI